MLSLSALGQTPDAILGTWWNAEKDGQVEVYKVGAEYRGRIVYVKVNVNPDGSSPKKDNLNPNEKLRSRVLMGTTILTGLRSEEHTSELQSPAMISYAVFCLKKKKRLNSSHRL